MFEDDRTSDREMLLGVIGALEVVVVCNCIHPETLTA